MRASVHLRWQHTVADEAGAIRRVVGLRALRAGAVWFASLEVMALWLLMQVGAALSGWVAGGLLAGVSLVAVGASALVAAHEARAVARSADWRLGRTEVAVDGRGLRWRGEEGVSAWRWCAVARCERTARGLWFTLHDGHRRWVPARALAAGDADAVVALRAHPEEAGGDFGPPRPAGGVAVDGHWTVAHWSAALPAVVHQAALGDKVLEGAVVLVLCNLFMGLWMRLPALLVAAVSLALLGWVSGGMLLSRWRAWWAIARFRRAVQRDPARAPLGPFALVVGPDGLWVQSRHGTRQCAWAADQSVVLRPEIVLLRLSGGSTVVVPREALADPDAWLAAVRSWIAAAGARSSGGPAPGRGAADGANPFAAPGGGR